MKIDKDYIENLREDYQLTGLSESDVFECPIRQFQKWFEEALVNSVTEPNAMTLATSTAKGVPSARIVLLKGFDLNGFVFYSNYDSKKGQELAENPHVSLVFFWPQLARQIRIDGLVEKISPAQSEAYFQSRPKGSQIGAMSSPQSKVIESRTELEEKYCALEATFEHSEKLPLPPNWGGYLVKPYRIEFWQGRSNRLHDRLQYTLTQIEPKAWKIDRLAP